MKFLNSEIVEYTFLEPINIFGTKLNSAQIGIVNFEINGKNETYKFPFYSGFHQISLDKKIAFIKEIINQNIHNEIGQLEHELDFIYYSFKLNFIDDYFSQSKEKKEIKINFFENINSSADKLDDSFSIKLKTNNKNIEDQSLKNKLVELSKNYSNILFRLDGNCQLDPNLLNKFLQNLPKNIIQQIEYFEEPLTKVDDSISILQKFNIPYAIDEHLQGHLNQLESLIHKNIVAVVKPSIIGVNSTQRLINHFHKVIISSAFDFKNDLKTLHHLADISNQHSKISLSHGLDTQKFLLESDQPFEIQSNKIKLR